MLMTGCNLVRGQAADEFRAAFTRRFHLPEPETLSAISLLRHIQRELYGQPGVDVAVTLPP